MRKLYFIFISLIFSCNISAQVENIEKGVIPLSQLDVMGVMFGWNKQRCKDVLDTKFGQSGSAENNKIVYFDIYYDNIFFDCVFFYFQSNGDDTFLSEVIFFKDYKINQSKDLIHDRELISIDLNKKYGNGRTHKNEFGFMTNIFGYNPIDNDYPLVKLEGLRKVTNNALSLVVDYGPINFVNPQDDI